MKKQAGQRKLTDVEREILTVCQLRADYEITRIAALCKRPVHQVRYVLSRLEGEGIIRPLPALNLHALGWVYGSVHFTVSSRKTLKVTDVVKKLQQIRNVTYVSCFSSEPQYEVSFAIDSIYAIQDLIDELARILPLAEKVIALRMEGALCGRKYLSLKFTPGPAIISRRLNEVVEIDAIDKRLLHCLINEPRSSISRIAALSNMPETSARLRIRKLEERQIIAGYRYHFQNDRIPVQDFKILVYTGSGSAEFRGAFVAFADRHRNVVYRSTCIGPWEFELDVEVEFSHEAAEICHEIRGRFPEQITRLQVLPRFYSQSFLQRMFD